LAVSQNSLYRLGLLSGYWRWRTPAPALVNVDRELALRHFLKLPDRRYYNN